MLKARGFQPIFLINIACYLIKYSTYIAVLNLGEVCPMPYALCPMPYALCPMPYALCPLIKRAPHCY